MTIPLLRKWRRFCDLSAILVLLAILVFLTAIAVPNIQSAVLRSQQKRSLADVRSVGTAVEEYAIDHGHYPLNTGPRGAVDTGLRVASWSRAEPRPVAELRSCLEPDYIRILPTTDGWGSTIYYDSNGTRYAVIAPAQGGTLESWNWSRSGPGHSWREDFIFTDGTFFKY